MENPKEKTKISYYFNQQHNIMIYIATQNPNFLRIVNVTKIVEKPSNQTLNYFLWPLMKTHITNGFKTPKASIIEIRGFNRKNPLRFVKSQKHP